MKTIDRPEDALLKAHAIGVLTKFGQVEVEGIGNRLTNWGVGITVTFKGIPRFLVRDCLTWVCDDVPQSFSNSRETRIYLTTLKQVESFCEHFGILPVLEEIIAKVKAFDDIHGTRQLWQEGHGRIHDKNQTIRVVRRLRTHAKEVRTHITEDLSPWCDARHTRYAFNRGKFGLSVGSSDLEQMRKAG